MKKSNVIINILLILLTVGLLIYFNEKNNPNPYINNILRLEIENERLKQSYLELENKYDSLTYIKQTKILEIIEIKNDEEITKQEVEKLSDSSSVDYFYDYLSQYSSSRDSL